MGEANSRDGGGATPAEKAAYRDLFDRSLDPILLVDPQSLEIMQANDATGALFSDRPEALCGLNLYQFSHPEDLETFQKMVRVAMRRYHPRRFEVRLVFGDPPKTIRTEIGASPLKLNDGHEVLQVILRDVTAQREAEQQLAELATTDGMTGLINYRQFMKLFEIEHQRCIRYKGSYAIVFLDVDNFKHYNDTNGHPAGDDLLRNLANVLSSCVRATDIAARYGGEEFVVLCTETDLRSAEGAGERIKNAIHAHKFTHGEKQPLGRVTASIGIAGFPDSGSTPEDVLKAADGALYLSKKSGRDQITLARNPLSKRKEVP